MKVSIAILTLLIAFQNCSAKSTEFVNYEGPIKHPDCPAIDDPFNPIQLPNPNDCNKFYKCSGGLAYPLKCPAGLHWSVNTNQCDWPVIAQCDEKISLLVQPKTNYEFSDEVITNSDGQNNQSNDYPISTSECPMNDDPEHPKHLPHSDCTKFYKCSHGLAYPMACPDGQHWSIKLDKCDWPEIAQCINGTNPNPEEPPTEWPTGPTEEPPKDPSSECPMNDDPEHPKHLPHSDCTKFYKCSNGVAYPMECPDGQHWSPKLDRCDWPEIAQCINGTNTTPEQPTTPPVTAVCTSIDNVTLLPHPTDCTKFIQCEYGTGHIRQCPDGLHFSVRENLCQWPEIADCKVANQ